MLKVKLINQFFFTFSWDEWVHESRVLKFNDQNVQKQKELQEAHK